MDFGKAFKFVFEDPSWGSKIIIGALLYLGSFLIFPIFFIIGYAVEVVQNVANGREPALPEWDDWGEKFRKGFMLSLVFFVYFLPIFLLMILVFLMAFVAEILGDSDVVGMIIGLSSVFINGAIMLYSLFISAVVPAIYIRYAVTEEFGQAFKLREIFNFIKENLGLYLIVFLLGFAINYAAGLGMFACCIGVFFTGFYALLVNSHLYGQLYLEAIKNKGST